MSKRQTISSLLQLYLGQKDELTLGSEALRGGEPIIKRIDFKNVFKRNRSLVFQVFVRCLITTLGSDIFLKQ